MKTIQIGIIGDYDETFPPHLQTNAALKHIREELAIGLEVTWLQTNESHPLGMFDGLWCAPGSPYKSLEGALRCVQYAREKHTPLLGTCGGFQHIVIEYARNIMSLEDAAHAEYDPYASNLFVEPLSCLLKGRSMHVRLEPNSFAARCYGSVDAEESYYCNFGLNPKYRQQMHEAGLLVTGWDAGEEARVVELPQHPFYIGTLFVPQAKSARHSPHPLIRAFVQAAMHH